MARLSRRLDQQLDRERPASIDRNTKWSRELPAKLLKLDENVVVIDFKAPVAPAGKAITRFEDKDDGSEYIYTLFVPMDADMAFPCFDQPDLKARFQLSVTVPEDWTAISNTQLLGVGGGIGPGNTGTEKK